MIRDEVLETLAGVFSGLRATFVRYVVATETAVVEDAADRKAAAFYEAWNRREEELAEAIHDRLEAHGVFASDGVWMVDFSQYNYLKASYLLRPVALFAERFLARSEKLATAVESSREAARLLQSVLKTEREFLDRARAMGDEIHPEAPLPAAIKGTSASRW